MKPVVSAENKGWLDLYLFKLIVWENKRERKLV
jgi:hypothetical protein